MGRYAWLVAVVAVLVTAPALAQETTHAGAMPEVMAVPDPLMDPAMRRSWAAGPPRLFAAVTVDAGYLYLRPRAHFGYGTPFRTWFGLEANPLIGVGGYGTYGGLRFAIPYADFRVGARYFAAFERTFLDPKQSYNRLDLDATNHSRSRYATLEAELNVAIPIGPGNAIATGSISDVRGVPDGLAVFEETLRVIVFPPLVWRARGGYLFAFGSHGQHAVGPVVDVLDVPGRDDSKTVRLGPIMQLQLSRRFEVRGSFVATMVSPDRLGLVGGDFTELGVRYRTASE